MKVDRLHPFEVETMPAAEAMEDGVLYISRRFELAIHLCACGCRGQAVTPIDRETLAWVLTDGDGGPTLHPSIGHQHWPCRSHYFITDGRVVPC